MKERRKVFGDPETLKSLFYAFAPLKKILYFHLNKISSFTLISPLCRLMILDFHPADWYRRPFKWTFWTFVCDPADKTCEKLQNFEKYFSLHQFKNGLKKSCSQRKQMNIGGKDGDWGRMSGCEKDNGGKILSVFSRTVGRIEAPLICSKKENKMHFAWYMNVCECSIECDATD